MIKRVSDIMEKISCLINNQNYTFDKGITLLGISKQVNTGLNNEPLVAYVDNVITELNYAVKSDCSIKFVDLNDRIGNRIYQKDLCFYFYLP